MKKNPIEWPWNLRHQGSGDIKKRGCHKTMVVKTHPRHMEPRDGGISSGERHRDAEPPVIDGDDGGTGLEPLVSREAARPGDGDLK